MTRAYLAGLVLGISVFLFAGGARMPPLAAHGDFAEQWAAARVIIDGGDPYDTATWRANAARLAGRASDSAAFVYPPYVALALTPLAALPVDVAASIWVALSLVVAALGVAALLRAYPPVHSLVPLGIGFALLASGGSLLALAQGQWSLLLLGLLSWSIAALVRDGHASGLAAALLAKPQLAPIALLGVARAASDRSRRHVALGVGIALALIALTAVRWDWWLEWARASIRFQGQPPIRTATLGTLFEPLGVWSVVAVGAVLTLVVGVSVRSDRASSLPRWLAAAVVIAPYTQAYDHALLIAPLVTATSRRFGHPAAGAFVWTGIAILVVADLAIAGLTAQAGRDVGSAVVPLALWGVVVAATRRHSPTNF